MANLSLNLIFFLVILQLVIGAEDGTADDSNGNAGEILPIIFIRQNNKFLYPTKVTRSVIKNRLSFTARDFRGDHFYCPAETPEQEKKIRDGLELAAEYPKLHEFHIYVQKNYPEYEEYLKYLQFSNYCLFEKGFDWGKPLTCPKEPTFAIRIVTRVGKNGEENVTCGPNDVGKLYEFFYLACPSTTLADQWNIKNWKMFFTNPDFKNYINKLSFLTVKHVAYRFCYDHDKMDTIYTKHRLRSVGLMIDDKIEYERKKIFQMVTDDYGFFNKKHLEKLKRIYEEGENLAKAKEKSEIENQNADGIVSSMLLQYKAHKLVPPEDFSTALWKKPPHHYLNVKPMHETLSELWDHIGEVILNNFRDRKIELDIYTGAFTTKSPEEKPPQYMYENEIQIPDTWIKLIYDFDKTSSVHYGTAITMMNYKVDEPDSNCPQHEDLCYPIIDEGLIEEKFRGAGHQICCEKIQEKHLKYFNLKLDVDGPLVIKSLNFEFEQSK